MPSSPIFAIGDVHGLAEQFNAALETAHEFLENSPAGTVVLIGDLIDRGPESLLCLELAAAFRDLHPGRVKLLAGNHEQMMLTACFHPNPDIARLALFNWDQNGGSAILAESLPTIRARLHRLRLEPHNWLSHYASGNVICVHAGVPSGSDGASVQKFLEIPLMDFPTTPGMSAYHWAWLRQIELRDFMPCLGYFIVHGHTPWHYRGEPAAGLMNLDAGSYKTGKIAAAAITAERITLHTFGF